MCQLGQPWQGGDTPAAARSRGSPTFVLDVEEALLPEAAERGDAGARPDEDAGHLRVLGQVEPGGTARSKERVKHGQAAPSLPPCLPSAHSQLRNLPEKTR